jgi:hypothetical protein
LPGAAGHLTVLRQMTHDFREPVIWLLEAGDDALTAGARWPMAIDAVYGQGPADDDEQRPD